MVLVIRGNIVNGWQLNADGTAQNPAIQFQAASQSGFYNAGNGNVGISVNGTQRCLVTSQGIVGNVVGNLTGNVAGNVVGNLTGNVVGTLTGNVIGTVTGNVVGNLLTNDGLSGLLPDSSSRRVNLMYGSWVFEVEGGIPMPLNKTKTTFISTGADQSFTVPANVTTVFAKMWGAGGGAGRAGGWVYGADAGGGGHTRGLVPVTPGEVLTLKVGAGGRTAVSANSYGGGGGAVGTTDIAYGGQGGGGTFLFRGSTPLLIAGGGGGGGSSRAWFDNMGGAGGGLQGERGESPYDGKIDYGGGGGTQLAGGTGTATGNGSLYQGGTSGVNSCGGGGGGGYYGGAGGGYSEYNTMGGGGGGSGFVGNTILFGGTFTGSKRIPAMYWDNDLSRAISNNTSIAHGGPNTQNNQGANAPSGGGGYAIIYY